MSVTKKVPERRCVGCNTSKPKRELLRVVRIPDGSVCIDLKGKISGRGAYICVSSECLRKAIKTKRLERSLSAVFTPEIYAALTGQVEAAESAEGGNE